MLNTHGASYTSEVGKTFIKDAYLYH